MSRVAQLLIEKNRCPDVLTRAGVRYLLRQRLAEEAGTCEEELRRKMERIRTLRVADIAYDQEKANEQHYELPTEFFCAHLGKRRKYSSCYFESPTSTLDEAEEAMLLLYCQRAGLKDGDSVLDLGCGWGSLTLYIAEHYPNCKITAVSNSWTQRYYIEAEAEKLGSQRVTVVTADIATADPLERNAYDVAFSIEMFEHMRNYAALLDKVAKALRPNGRLFVHIFCHARHIYHFETDGPSNWMGKHFFTGGTMPCDDVLVHFQDKLALADHWRVDGRHYAQTAELWLANFDRNIAAIRPVLAATYRAEATKFEAYWRTFYIAVAETFGFRGGQEWFVSHMLFRKRS